MVKPLHWDITKWSLNRGGLLIELKMYDKAIMTEWSLNRGSLQYWNSLITNTDSFMMAIMYADSTNSQFVSLHSQSQDDHYHGRNNAKNGRDKY